MTNDVSVPTSHNMTWMPSDPMNCPCDECQDQIDREIRLDREAMWPFKLDWHVHLGTSYPVTCVCGGRIASVFTGLKGSTKVASEKHAVVQVFVRGGSYVEVRSVHIHLGCVLLTRDDLSMETQARNILILEDLPDLAKKALGKLYQEDT